MHRRGVLLALLGALALAPELGAKPSLVLPADLGGLVARFVAAEQWRAQGQGQDPGELRQVLFQAAQENRADPKATVLAVAKALDLPRGAAAALVEADLASWRAQEAGWTAAPAQQESRRAWIARAAASHAAALRLAPEAPRLALEQAAFYDSWANEDATYVDKLATILAQAPTAVGLIGELERTTGFESRSAVMSRWIARAGSHPVLLAELAKGLRFPPARTPALGAALEGLARFAPASTVEIEAYLLGERLADLLGLGLVELALGEFDAASPAARAQILAGTGGPFEATLGGLSLRADRRDLRLELAAARALTGRRAAAAEVFAGLPPLPAPPGPEAPAERVLRDLLAEVLSPGQEGAAERLAAFAGLELSEGRAVAMWRALAVQLALRLGDPALAGRLLRTDCAERQASVAALGELGEARPELPADVVARAEALAALLERSLADLRREIGDLATAETAGADPLPAQQQPVDERACEP